VNSVPTLVVPGCGGIDMQSILDPDAVPFNAPTYYIPQGNIWAVNPRGMRPGSVHNDIFFAAIPLVLQKHPEVIFICPNFAGSRQAEDWLDQYHIHQNTFLLPKLPQQDLWALFKHSELFISPSSHDGTPNTLLEALACGCFPIVGDIESLREWVENGKNGLLIDPQDPQALADAISQALESPELRQKAATLNKTLIQQRASIAINRPKIKEFYMHLISRHK
ncbi:MAG: glycosyltransferase family 4 protein, partial [Chloroflexota bacterium]